MSKDRLTYQDLIVTAGLSPNAPRWSHIGERPVNTALKVFNFIPQDSDPRWAIVHEAKIARSISGFKQVHWECALQAIYLSRERSYRNEYNNWGRVENVRQLLRAIKNIQIREEILGTQLESMKTSAPAGFRLESAITDSVSVGVNAVGITGCPEALYQLRLFLDEKYIGRIGFNLHDEGGFRVISITNLQGIPNGLPIYEKLRLGGFRPFTETLMHLKRVFLPNGYDIRGIKNPRVGNRAFYNTTFKKARIKRMSFKRVSGRQMLPEES